jgi:hypothetical protein
MYVTRIPTKIPLSKQTATQLTKAVASFSQHGVLTQTPGLHLTLQTAQPRRQFSSTSRTRLRDYFPEPEHDHQIQKTDPAWPHPPYVLSLPPPLLLPRMKADSRQQIRRRRPKIQNLLRPPQTQRLLRPRRPLHGADAAMGHRHGNRLQTSR